MSRAGSHRITPRRSRKAKKRRIVLTVDPSVHGDRGSP
jgi:hypothetical protein